MASTTRALRTQWLRPRTRVVRPAPAVRSASSFAHLQTELPRRLIPPTFEDLSPQSSYRLETTLADFLPATQPPPVLPPTRAAAPLPIPHHLVYFEPSKRASEMLPDGTNPDHSPGAPFSRRMWAGGRVRYDHANPLRLDGRRGVCAEFVRNVTIKGGEGAEKVFVAIERRLATVSDAEIAGLEKVTAQGLGLEAQMQAREDLDHRVRQRLWRDNEEDFGECSVIETRNIVFMRSEPGSSKEQLPAKGGDGEAKTKKEVKVLKPQHSPDYTHTFTPDPKLLFRFSALTFNAHAIHLDPQWSREVEGHRNLLFHGPMSFTFLVTLLQQELRKQGNEVIKSVDYRNLAPLYCSEPVTFCGTRTGDHKWEVWAQTPEGGLAVKGSVVTEAGQ